MKLSTDEMADACLPDLDEMTLGELRGLKKAYLQMAETRRSGKPLPDQPEPYSLFKAEIWDRCAEFVEMEIETRSDAKAI